MTSASGRVDGAVSLARGLLWIYTVVSCLVGGLLLANAFPTTDDNGYPTTNFGGFLGGVLLAAFATLPFWALYILGARAIEVWSRQRRSPGATATQASGPRVDAAPAPPAQTASASKNTFLAELLADPVIHEQAVKTRRTYSRKVAAEFLTRKAAEAGHEGVTFTSADLPEDF